MAIEMNGKSAFGATYTEGSSLKTLSELRKFFQETHGVIVNQYIYTRETPSRPSRVVSEAMKLECSICGRKLYGVDSKEAWDERGVRVPYIKARQHMLVTDIDGKVWPTCYKLNMCYRTVGFIPEPKYEAELPIPSFEDFIALDDSSDDRYVEALRSSYLHTVLPFLIKWARLEVTKANVIEFLDQWLSLQEAHLKFYEDGPSQRRVSEKILRIIGVKV